MTHPANEKSNELKTFNELKSELKHMPEDPGEEWFETLLARVRDSKDSRTIAFKVLSEIALKRRPFPRLHRIKGDLERIFYDGISTEIYSNDISQTHRTLKNLFIRCSGSRDLRDFYSELHYLAALLPVIQASYAPKLFDERLCLFSEAFVKHARQSRYKPNSRKSQSLEIRPEEVSSVLLQMIPNSGGQPKKLEDLLTAVEYLREIWTARVDQSKQLEDKVATLTQRLEAKEARNEELVNEVAESTQVIEQRNAQVDDLEADLAKKQELLGSQQHLIGHREESAKRDSYTRFSRRLKRYLENLRLFADRDEPNRTGILEELDDIERFMVNFEEEL